MAIFTKGAVEVPRVRKLRSGLEVLRERGANIVHFSLENLNTEETSVEGDADIK